MCGTQHRDEPKKPVPILQGGSRKEVWRVIVLKSRLSNPEFLEIQKKDAAQTKVLTSECRPVDGLESAWPAPGPASGAALRPRGDREAPGGEAALQETSCHTELWPALEQRTR